MKLSSIFLSALFSCAAVSATAAPLPETTIRVSDYLIDACPGSTLSVNKYDSMGKLETETFTVPESAEMKSARKAAEAETKYPITIKINPDKNGKNAKANNIHLLGGTFLDYFDYSTSGKTFNVPKGKYLLQATFSDDRQAIIFVPDIEVDGNGEKTVEISADMATKCATMNFVLPTGEHAVLPTFEDGAFIDAPYNLGRLVVTFTVAYNGVSRNVSMNVMDRGGDQYPEVVKMWTNDDPNIEFTWMCAGEWGDSMLPCVMVAPATSIESGAVISNKAEDWMEFNPSYKRTPCFDPSLTPDDEGYADGNAFWMFYNVKDNHKFLNVGLSNYYTHLKFYVSKAGIADRDYTVKYSYRDFHHSYAEGFQTYYSGIDTPTAIYTESGMRYYPTQGSNNYCLSNVPDSGCDPTNPWFAYNAEEGQLFGSTAPYAVTFSRAIGWRDVPYRYYEINNYLGNFAEDRTADATLRTYEVRCDNQLQDLSDVMGLEEWFYNRAASGAAPAQIQVKWTNTNAEVDGMPSKNICEIEFNEASEDVVPPTVQLIMFADKDGQPVNHFDNASDGLLKICGGDFSLEAEDTDLGLYSMPVDYVTCSPASIKVEYAPTDTDNFLELPMKEDSDKFVPAAYGYYWEAPLSEINAEGPTGWYDLRLTMTDEANNTQRQLITRAFRIDKFSSINSVSTDNHGFSVKNGSVISASGDNVEVYSISGARVDNRNLASGIYVAVSGNEYSKVIVK